MRKERLLFPKLLRILASFFIVLLFQILKLDPFTPIPILGVPFSTVVIFLLSALTAKLLSRLSMTKKLV